MMKKIQKLTDNHYEWLKEKKNLLYVSTKLDEGDIQILYGIYNQVTGENKRPNGCGSCLRATISQLRQAFELHDK
jgi:hypothetical protein